MTNAETDVDVADTGTDVETDAAENDAADIVVDTETADAQSEDVETDSTEDLFCLLDVPSAVSSVFPQAVKENASIELNIIAKIFLFIIFLSFVICFSFLSVDINVPYFVLQWINLF